MVFLYIYLRTYLPTYIPTSIHTYIHKCITLQYNTLHCIALRCVALRCIALPSVTCTALNNISSWSLVTCCLQWHWRGYVLATSLLLSVQKLGPAMRTVVVAQCCCCSRSSMVFCNFVLANRSGVVAPKSRR